jgi:hypothetical protein
LAKLGKTIDNQEKYIKTTKTGRGRRNEQTGTDPSTISGKKGPDIYLD